MASPASVKKHPIHTMLVPIPIGLLVFSLVSDLIYAMGGGSVWNDVAFFTMAGGIVGALLAAVPGLIDLLSLTGPARKIGLWHMSLNLIVVAMYAINLWLRLNGAGPDWLPITMSVAAVALLCVSGWLGGELVYVRGIGVEPQPQQPDIGSPTQDRGARRVA
jgi:uncharacterized membrane protein